MALIRSLEPFTEVIDRPLQTDLEWNLRLPAEDRVKNNLQMITALIRLETRNIPDDAAEKIQTVGQAVKFIEENSGKG